MQGEHHLQAGTAWEVVADGGLGSEGVNREPRCQAFEGLPVKGGGDSLCVREEAVVAVPIPLPQS